MKPTVSEQREEVAKIFAVCGAAGVPLETAILVAIGYFQFHDLNPPASIKKFLAGTEVPAPGSWPKYMN